MGILTDDEKRAAMAEASPILDEIARVFKLQSDHEVFLFQNGEYEGRSTIRKAGLIAKQSRARGQARHRS